ncbi:MAG: S8 family serine peptidase [Bacteroidota bacterium]
MCRNVITLSALLVLLLSTRAQAVQYAYQVTFTDKNNTPFSLSSPGAYLSSRALARRTAQGISVDSSDLPVNKVYIDSVLALTGGKIHSVSRWLNLCVILVPDSAQMNNLNGKTFIAGRKFVAYYAGILHRTVSSGSQAAAMPAANKTTAFDATFYGNTWSQTLQVSGNYLHSNGHLGSGKLIAVFDAGFIGTNTHTGFDSMRNAGRLLDTHNFTLDNNTVYSYDDHGTKALSTMAGYVPGAFVGSAPLASYALYVTEDGNSEQPIELLNMLSATERADSLGVDIVSSSLGYNTFPDFPSANLVFATDLDGKTTIAAQAANIATRKGMLFVTSAGNEGGNSWNKILTPGDADSALTIGNVDLSGNVAANSGYGPNAAGQVKPDVCVLGQPAGILTVTGFGFESGTSFSTPQVAGWAACLWETKPASSPYQVRQAIIKCASHYTTPTDHIGYGIPDFRCTADILRVTPLPGYGLAWVAAMPNPFTGDLTLNITGDSDQYVDMQLVDVTGKMVFTTSIAVYRGYNAPISVSAGFLPKGVYILRAASATRTQVLKLEKL